MADSIYADRKKRIRRVIFALLIAFVLIGGAYAVSDPTILNIFSAQTANAESTQQLLAAFAQQKGPDGKPLWEDQLIATSSSSPIIASSTAITTYGASSTPDAGSGTLTDQFAQNLFEQYVTQYGGTTPSDDDIDTFAEQAVQSLAQSHTEQNLYSVSDVHTETGGAAALESYASDVQNIFEQDGSADPSITETGLDYFADAVERNETYKLPDVAIIGDAYTQIATALMQLQVPTEAEYSHLEIANAMAHIGQDYADMSAFASDPLRAYLGLTAYETDEESLVQGMDDMQTVFINDHAVIDEGTPGYRWYVTLGLASSTQP